MANANTQLISLLRAFVQGSAPERGEPWDTAGLWRLAVQQNLLPVLAYENKQWQLFPEETPRLDKLLYGAVAGAVQRCAAFEALSRTLSEGGILHMPVKGYYLRQLYPAPEVRTFGDIDILIHERDRQRVHELLLAQGFETLTDWEPTYSYRRGAEHYEFHTNLMDGNLDDRADLRAYFGTAWDHAQRDEALRYCPEAAFHLIYVVCHLAKHLYGGGAGLRMYLDVAFYIQHFDQTLDWKTVTDALSALHLFDFFCTVMHACRTWFGVETRCPLPEPDSGALDELLAYTLDADLFGHSRDHAVVRLRNEGEEKDRKRVLLRMAFPPAGEIERRYTFLQGRHWLLPAAWAARLAANFRRLPGQLRGLRRVAQADASAVDAYDALMKRLGL